MRISRLSLVGSLIVGMAPIVWALANPASENCLKNGGKIEMRETAQGQYGVCVWAEEEGLCDENHCYLQTECEEWAFFRGHCQKGECAEWLIVEGEKKSLRSYCAQPIKKVADKAAE